MKDLLPTRLVNETWKRRNVRMESQVQVITGVEREVKFPKNKDNLYLTLRPSVIHFELGDSITSRYQHEEQ